LKLSALREGEILGGEISLLLLFHSSYLLKGLLTTKVTEDGTTLVPCWGKRNQERI